MLFRSKSGLRMESKKQLIIVPPMSEALKKLNEVLEGIAGDENIEISMIDDLKELGQVLANTGQCLILCSNAKKCATFLQENRFLISRYHTKTMLFTPKEIPAKTLVKFTKVGLTESILENSPPKTLLYKIKLQLRSIKTASPDKEKDVAVKSLTDNIEQKPVQEEEKIRERSVSEETAIEEISIRKKKDSDADENVVDYGGSLKGKMKVQEDLIETHWKSKRKTDEIILDVESGETKKKTDSFDDIDNYYRNKKKNEELPLEAADDYRKKERTDYEVSVEEKKRKSQYQDMIQDEFMQTKKLDQKADEEIDLQEREKGLDLDLQAGKEEKEVQEDYVAALLDMKKKAALKHIELEEAASKKEKEQVDDLGGHYKGKVNNLKMDLDESSETEVEKEAYDNTDLQKEKNRSTELDLSPAARKKRREEESEGSPTKTHEGEVDKLRDENMDGATSTDHIETFMDGVTTSSRKSQLTDASGAEKTDEKTSEYEKDDPLAKKKSSSALEAADSEKRNKGDNIEGPDDISLKKVSQDNVLGAEDSQEKEDLKQDEEMNLMTRSSGLVLEEAQNKEREKQTARNTVEEEDLNLKSLSNTKLDIEKERAASTEGKVDKIDTFYRGGDAKKQEHSWDNLTDKKKDVDLNILKSHKAEINIAKNVRNDAGEVVIDYRKLKEEFDLISSGREIGESTAISEKRNGAAIDPEDEGSFKVIELHTQGIDLSISLLNLIYQKNVKPKVLFTLIAEDILTKYNGATVFWEYRAAEKKHIETYNSYLEMHSPMVSDELKLWWPEYKKNETLLWHFQNRSMSTWRCQEILERNLPWEDIELPSWAQQELADKRVELAFPYFDGVDRMGLALVNFHEGLRAEDEHAILTTLEMARTLFLDTIQRVKTKEEQTDEDGPAASENEPNKVLNFFGGLFGKKKAG